MIIGIMIIIPAGGGGRMSIVTEHNNSLFFNLIIIMTNRPMKTLLVGLAHYLFKSLPQFPPLPSVFVLSGEAAVFSEIGGIKNILLKCSKDILYIHKIVVVMDTQLAAVLVKRKMKM